MVSLGNITLEIFEGPPTVPVGKAMIRVSYKIDANHHDAEHEQAYREQVQLFGDDRGEGGSMQLIPGPDGNIADGVVVFTTSQTGFQRIWEKTIDSSSLDEDPGPPLKKDEIGALVTLTPIPPTVIRESNVVDRGEPIVHD
jgi:hypothetical protein